jgi:hypothetical protein
MACGADFSLVWPPPEHELDREGVLGLPADRLAALFVYLLLRDVARLPGVDDLRAMDEPHERVDGWLERWRWSEVGSAIEAVASGSVPSTGEIRTLADMIGFLTYFRSEVLDYMLAEHMI